MDYFKERRPRRYCCLLIHSTFINSNVENDGANDRGGAGMSNLYLCYFSVYLFLYQLYYFFTQSKISEMQIKDI